MHLFNFISNYLIYFEFTGVISTLFEYSTSWNARKLCVPREISSLKYISLKKVSHQRRCKTKTALMRNSRDTFEMRPPTQENVRFTHTHGPFCSRQQDDKQTLLSTFWYKWDITHWSSFPINKTKGEPCVAYRTLQSYV
jgi:hypothetical protein